MKKITNLFIFSILIIINVTGQNTNDLDKNDGSQYLKLELEELKNEIEIVNEKLELYKQIINEQSSNTNNRYNYEMDSFKRTTDYFFNIFTLIGVIITLTAGILTFLGFKNISSVKKSYISKFKIELEKEKEKTTSDFINQLNKFYNDIESEYKEFKDQIIENTQIIIDNNTHDFINSQIKSNFKLQETYNSNILKELQNQLDFLRKYGKETPEARLSQGIIYNEQNEYIKAIEEFDKAIELNPSYFLAYANRSLSYKGLEEYVKAITDLTKCIELNPKTSEAYAHRGYIYSKMKDYRNAISDYEKSISNNPKLVYGIQNIIEIYLIEDEYEKALDHIKKLKKLSVKDEDKVVVLYLEIITNISIGNDTRILETELHSYQEKEYKIDWSWEEFDYWVENNSLSISKNKKIKIVNTQLRTLINS